MSLSRGNRIQPNRNFYRDIGKTPANKNWAFNINGSLWLKGSLIHYKGARMICLRAFVMVFILYGNCTPAQSPLFLFASVEKVKGVISKAVILL